MFEGWRAHYITNVHRAVSFWLAEHGDMLNTPAYYQMRDIKERAAKEYDAKMGENGALNASADEGSEKRTSVLNLTLAVEGNAGTGVEDMFDEASRLATRLGILAVDFDFNGWRCTAFQDGTGSMILPGDHANNVPMRHRSWKRGGGIVES